MLRPDEDNPTHTAWVQHLDRGKFRAWYKSGKVWLPDPKIIGGRLFQAVPTIRGGDGFTYFFPIGMEPPPPQEPKRPGASGSGEEI